MLRGEHTVLLTTHCMEEADVLGDRVAVLHAGQLRCHATPMHLQKNIGWYTICFFSRQDKSQISIFCDHAYHSILCSRLYSPWR